MYMYILYICLIHIYIYTEHMTWHFSTSNVPPRCQSLPQRRSKGSAKESGKAWMFLAKKIPERFPNWKFEDVFYGCLILVLVNDFAHLPWGDSPNFQKKCPQFERLSLHKLLVFKVFWGIFQGAFCVFFFASPFQWRPKSRARPHLATTNGF